MNAQAPSTPHYHAVFVLLVSIVLFGAAAACWQRQGYVVNAALLLCLALVFCWIAGRTWGGLDAGRGAAAPLALPPMRVARSPDNGIDPYNWPWLGRYALALCIIVAAIWAGTTDELHARHGQTEWIRYGVVVMLVFWAASLMREIVLLLIALGILGAFVGALAGLPTSAAIIIGAIIIAGAIQNRASGTR